MTKRRRSNIIPSKITIGEQDSPSSNIHLAAEAFMKHCKAKNLAERTIGYHRDGTRGVEKLMTFCEVTRPDEITEQHVRDYVIYRLESGIKPATINQNLRTWKVFGNFLKDYNYIPRNPFLIIEKLKVERKIQETLDNDQIQKLFETLNLHTFVGLRDYAIMMLFLETGCRLREALEIKISDIDWRGYLIKINGKGRKQRYVPFQETLANLLREYISVRGRLEHDVLFVSRDDLPLKNRSIIDNFEKYGLKARIRIRCTPHIFRYTFARMYIENGGDPFSLKTILGHTTMDMVNHYVETWGTDIAKKHAKFSPVERLFKPKGSDRD